MVAREILIENVGAIRRLQIPVPEDGGVVVLQGTNGSGKTTAIDAVSAMLDGDGGLAVRDGEDRGFVQGLGCEVSVKKRTSHAGTLEVQRVHGEDPALLVDPGVADPVAADRARIRALCRLAKVKPSKALFAAIEETAGVPLPITLAEDVPETAARTKRAIQAKARDLEDQANTAAGRMQALLGGIGEVPLDGPCDADALHAAADEATRALLRAEGEAQGRFQALQAAQAAREALERARGTYSGPTVEGAQGALRAAETAEREAREALARASAAKNAADADLRRAIEFSNACIEWDRAVAAAEGLTAVDAAALTDLRDKVRAAREAEARGREIRRAREQKAEAQTALEEMDRLRQQAERLREAAAGCDRVVSEAIGSVAPRGLAVEGDRLTVEHARGRIPFAELSHGERWTIALDVAIDAVGENGLLAIAQEAWEGLDEDHRRQIAEHARRRRAVVLTAEATMSELTAEVL
jgi:energy-coupling factor transporter ATP-binding protein EcfA2